MGGMTLFATPAMGREALAEPWAIVDTLAQGMIAARTAPGLSLCARRRGRTLFSKGYGLADLETGGLVTPATVFRVGSLAKQFTAAVLLLLAEEGRLSLSDALVRWVPTFPRAREITLREMMGHTSGLGDYTKMPFEMLKQRARLDYGAEALVQEMAATNPLFVYEPGAAWAYSNTAYVLLGLVIERASGRSYADLLRERLFEPLGLARTAVDSASEVVPDRASGYTYAKAAPGLFDHAAYISLSYVGAAGALRSTPDELCRWHELLLSGRVLAPENLRQMTTPVRTRRGDLPLEVTSRAVVKTENPVRHGFGLNLDPERSRRCLAHAGNIFGFSAQLRSYPNDGVTVALVVNTDSSPDLGSATRTLREAMLSAALQTS